MQLSESVSFLISQPTFTKKSNKNRDTLEQVLDKLSPFLEQQDILSLKLTCRCFYYFYVTADVWLGLKLNIAEQKLQYYDDYDFEEAETKQISRKDKNIRIHSLKKQNEAAQTRVLKRQPSNVKEKGKIISQNNELLFRNTEVGFKRLLAKPNLRKKLGEGDYDIKEVSELPKIDNLQEYRIKINDPWSVNMGKAQKLLQLFKRINQFHNKLLSQLKLPAKDLYSLLSKLKRISEKVHKYGETSSQQPYRSIIQSVEPAKQNLLIDDQLNKVCRLFWSYHSPLLCLDPQVVALTEVLSKQKPRLDRINDPSIRESVQFIEMISGIDESADLLAGFCEKNPELGKLVCSQVVAIIYGMVEQVESRVILFADTGHETKIEAITWSTLSRKPFFYETLLQILSGLSTKLVKLASTLCPDQLSLSIVLGKLRNIKQVCQALLSIAKYFGKLKKQLEEKQKKSKGDSIIDTIREFISSYEGREEGLWVVKNPAKAEKIIGEFKDKIGGLKGRLQQSN